MSRKLSFLWHMHQPDYENKEGFLQMPWVFLHSIKDYYDMPWLLSLYPSLKATFNITPPLIKQIKIYEKEGYKKDRFLLSWVKDVAKLNHLERAFIIKICKSAQFDSMVKPFERYVELYHYDSYSDVQLNDLEVLFMLSWCGNFLRKNSNIVKKLIVKGRDFANDDKVLLIEELIGFIPKILPFYSTLLKNGQISLSTTPLNHPILPLLLDMNNAKISNPKTELPKEYISLRDDALKQVDMAIELYEKVFGKKPTGFWPAEGAVDEESLKIYKSRGLKWVATDESILFKSLNKEDNDLKYKRYDYNGVFIGFRDHQLSDKIGFNYRYKDANKAVEDFISCISDKKDESNIFVIVDGENAWEFYKNSAYDFFVKLYEQLSSNFDIKTLSFDEVSKLEKEELDSLFPGSWIYGTFDTWVGHSEKNRAWELIYRTKKDIAFCKNDKKTKELIENHFLLSECSDWFWWYGDDHFSDFLEDFDKLFRSHLVDIYKLCSLKPPLDLYLPISKSRETKLSSIEPKSYIKVKIDGKNSSFFEWLGSGMVDESRFFSTMDGAKGVINKLYYGEDKHHIYLRLDGDIKKFLKEFEMIKIHIKSYGKILQIRIKDEVEEDLIKMKINDIVEMSIDKKVCGLKKDISLQLELINRDKSSEYIPIFGDIKVCKDDYVKNWFV